MSYAIKQFLDDGGDARLAIVSEYERNAMTYVLETIEVYYPETLEWLYYGIKTTHSQSRCCRVRVVYHIDVDSSFPSLLFL